MAPEAPAPEAQETRHDWWTLESPWVEGYRVRVSSPRVFLAYLLSPSTEDGHQGLKLLSSRTVGGGETEVTLQVNGPKALDGNRFFGSHAFTKGRLEDGMTAEEREELRQEMNRRWGNPSTTVSQFYRALKSLGMR